MSDTKLTVLDTLRSTRSVLNAEIDRLIEADLPEEREAAEAANAEIREKLADRDALDERIKQVESAEARRAADGAAAVERGETRAPATTEGKDLVYARGNGQSYYRDMILAVAMRGSSEGFDAERRLNDHAAQMDRVAAKDIPAAFRAGPTKRAAGFKGMPEARVNPNRTDGQGGYFVPPLWLVDEFIPYLRAGRTTANLHTQMDLPPGTDSISIPKLTLGTLTGVQQDNGAVTSQDITDSYVTASVRTVAGQEDVAIQLLEQSPVAFDEILAKDLSADYNQRVDVGVLTGTNANGQLAGLLNLSNMNAVTFTTGSPTAALLYPILGQAASQIARQRFQMPTGYVMTPQRWFWLVTQVDSTGRPLVLPKGSPGFNAMGSYDGDAEGLVGEIFGQPIYVDANIPSNVGAGTNQDTIYNAKWDDLYLFEGALRTRVLVEVLSGTLQIRVQLYNYVASLQSRFPVSVSAINGTGLISPSGF